MAASLVFRTAGLTAVAALTLALAACSGSSDADASATAGTTDVAPTTSAAPGTGTAGVGTDASASPSAGADDGTDNGDGAILGAGGAVCTLLDEATIEAVTGRPFTTVAPTADAQGDKQTMCEWELEGDAAAIVQVLVLDGQASTIAIQRTAAEGMYDDVADAEVEGASKAFSYFGGLVLVMADGEDYVQVMYKPVGQADTAALTVQLAQEVIANH